MTRAIGYVRVSTEDQSREGVSLEAQTEKIQAYAVVRGFALTAVFREEGVSGKIPLRLRPEGAKLVDLLERRKAEHLVAVKLDRLFRNAADALAQTEQWDRRKRVLHILDLGGSFLDTSSTMGRMFFTMAAGFAEMERKLIGDRTRAAFTHKRVNRLAYSRITPYGFDRVGDRLISNETETEVIAFVKQCQVEGHSLADIAGYLNESGTQTKLGGRWYPVTLQKILRRQSLK